MPTPEISPNDYDDVEYVLTEEEREWADELRDEFIIIANEHFTNVIDPSNDFLEELTFKFNRYILKWMNESPVVTCIDDPDGNSAIICTTNIGVIHALRSARDEVCEYLDQEFGV